MEKLNGGKLNGIIINDEDYLVERLPDYFKKKEKNFDTRIIETMPVHVGIIKKAGKNISQEVEGNVLYYMSDIADRIEIKNIGNFELVNDKHKYLIRTDEDSTNI
jgi:hypothetical protein